ncbi:MAG: prephenate dehydratase [Desulfatirhabdiaceae bacterium]
MKPDILTETNIDSLRAEIDTIDEQLLNLMSRRLTAARKIGTIKSRNNARILDAGREKTIFQRLTSLNRGPLTTTAMHHIFSEIIAASREIQGPVSIAYLGPEGTFTHMAAIQQFGHLARLTPFFNISDVFQEIDKGNYHYGVVPVENSIEGAVNHTLDLFLETHVSICAEIYMNIAHDLLSVSDDLSEIRVIHSHPQAFAQCRKWMRTHLPHAVFEACSSTAVAAQKARDHSDAAAIASRDAAHIYQLKTVASRIEDSACNTTRFLVIGQDSPAPSENDKTSLMFATSHTPGSLYQALKPLNDAAINMVKLESRPARYANWSYIFFTDIEGHIQDSGIQKAVSKMKPLCMFIKCLGSYPRAETVF